MPRSPITSAEIQAAEKLMGIRYTKREREQMLASLDEQILAAKARRKSPFENSVPMASRFDPRLPGFELPQPSGVKFSVQTPALPKREQDIAFAALPELAHWIATGALTSERLTTIYLDRIAQMNDQLKCFAHVCPDRALNEARAMDAATAKCVSLGPLHGIPYGVKDLFDTQGLPTGWGAEPYQDRVPDQDAFVVQKLRDAGAVLLGKTTVGALAYGDLWYGGRTANPWNLNEGSSGSSAGSAAATAAGLCGFSIGTETLGSITSPSHRCGTTGLRPTFGRVSRAGAMALCWSLDKVGPICRGVEDTAMVLQALNGADPQDRGSIDAPFSFDASRPISDLTIGYLPEAFREGATAIDQAVLDAAKGLGAKVIEVALPDLPYDALVNILRAEAAAAFEELTLSGQDDLLSWQDDDAWPNTFRMARFLSAVDHVQLDRLRYQVMEALDALFQQVDVLIGPFSTGPMLVASNFTGHPCLHLRAGFEELPTRSPGSLSKNAKAETESSGKTYRVPQGISLWGKLFDEGPLLSVGLALERVLGVAGVRPDLPR